MILRAFLHQWLLRLAALSAAAFLIVSPLRAFDQAGAGARGAGMADAQTAVADDANAAFNNPAGLIQVGDPRLSAELSQFNRGLSDGSSLEGTYLGYAHPVKAGETVLGGGYRSFDVSGLLSERTYLVGGARRLSIEPFGWKGVWSVGANLKMLERAFKTDVYAGNAISNGGSASGQADPLLAGSARATAFGLDVGAMFQFGRNLDSSVGLTLLNLNRPNVGLSASDKVPGIFKFGYAHRPKWGLVTAEVRRAERLNGRVDSDVALGAERHFRLRGRSAVSVRGGYAEGSRGYKAVTAGASYIYDRYAFDYALTFPIGNLSDTNGTQRLGVSVRFGAAEPVRPSGDPYGKLELLESFSHDSLAAHFLMTRTPGLTPDERNLANRLVARRYPLDDRGLSKAAPEIQMALKDGKDWNDTLTSFGRGLSNEDLPHMLTAVTLYAGGDARGAYTRLTLLSPDAQRRPLPAALQMLALGESAAARFRSGSIAPAVDDVRRAAALAPSSDVIQRGLRMLEGMLRPIAPEPPAAQPEPAAESAPTATLNEAAAPVTIPMALPVEPEPVAEPVVVAPVSEPVVVPPAVQAAPIQPPAKPVAAPEPAAKPAAPVMKTAPVVKPAPPATPKPVAKPAKPVNAEVEKAWRFYDEAVSRDVSDREKIEILQNMLRQFGESQAPRINEELSRLRRRLSRTSAR